MSNSRRLKISGGHVADQGGDHSFSVPIRGQQFGARGFRCPAQPAPDVDLIAEKIEEDGSKVVSAVSAGEAKCSLPRQLNTTKPTPSPEVWILICLRDSEVSARRIHSSHGIPKIVVLHQRRSDQFLELLV